MTIQEAEKKIAETVAQQAIEDEAGLKAASATLPGPLRDVFSPAPDIAAGPYKVRRFVDGDFVALAALGHPLNGFKAVADGSYGFEPSGQDCWTLCWLLTRPRKESKALFREKGAAAVKDAAEDEFGEHSILALSKVMEAVAQQMTTYASANLEMQPRKTEGENGSNPPSAADLLMSPP